MPSGALTLYVSNRSTRADEILDHIASEVGHDGVLRADDDGYVRFPLVGDYAEAYASAERALHSSGPDWYEHVAMGSPRPQ